MKKVFFAITLAAVSFVAQAGAINGLQNTGATGAAHVSDANYTVTDTNGSTISGYVTGNDYPVGKWWANNTPASSWITANSVVNANMPVGNYVWRTSFDLTGFSVASANFQGRFSADDYAVVYLNGHAISASGDFNVWTNFSSQSAFFVEGLNTLEFQAHNNIGPTSLRVEITNSSATALAVSAVPEPETLALMVAGLAALGLMVRRREPVQAD